MAVLARDIVNETRALLFSGSRPEINLLAEDLDASETAVDVSLAIGGIQRGAVLSVDLELMFVTSATSPTATVIRGFLGSVAATHATGSMVEVNPLYSDFQILRAVNAELDSYSSPVHGLYRPLTLDVVYNPTRSGYDLAGVTGILDILAVEAKGDLSGDRHRINRWRLIRNQDTADFTSGFALYLYEGPTPGKTIEVTYKAPFTALAALATDMSTTGLPTTAYDIPPLGAAARLVAAREVVRARIDSQPEPRAAQDVPPGTSRQAAGGLLALRNQRLVEEASRLQSFFPSLSRVV